MTPPLATPSPTTPWPATTTVASGGLNDAEERIRGALSRLGLMAEVGQETLSDRADMLVDLGAGRYLQVVLLPAAAAPVSWQVTSVRELAGAELRTVRDSDGGTTTEWIVCGADLVRVFGSAPDSDRTLDMFIQRFIPELGCR